ncbi:hypothetical protein MKX01_023295 [Papaver californicum]|nr:hypothetical protein MKX01_023295 [Papaver californicum]
MEPDTFKQRIQDIILRLDNIIEVNNKMNRGYDAKGGYAQTSMEENKLANQEQEFSNSESMILNEICSIILKGLVKEYVDEFYEYGVEHLISEFISNIYVIETITKRNEDLKRYYLERDIKKDICQLVLSSHLQNTILERKGNDLVIVSSFPGELLQYVEELIGKDVYAVLLQEIVKEWNTSLEIYSIERHIEEELYNIVFRESIKDMHGFTSLQCQTTGLLIGEEVCTTILQEMFKAWKDAIKKYNTESWISKDVSQIVSSVACWKSRSQDNVMEDIYVNRLSSLECKIKEDAALLNNVNMILKDLESHKYENLVEEENHVVMNEVVKDLKVVIKFTLKECQEAKNQVKISLVREDVCKVVLREMIKEWNKEVKIHNLESYVLREMKHHFEPDVELVSSLKKRESLYRKAFLRRCYDLQKAETEVDLLGDEVNALLSLLEKIYRSLEQILPKVLYGPAAYTSLL